MQEIYFDNAATTKPSQCVIDTMLKVLSEDYGNPSSLHRKGMYAENYIRESQEIIASSLKVDKSCIYFTSGGSESNNTAIIGCAKANNRLGKHIITTKIEHAAVANPMNYLKDKGYEITYLNVDKDGYIDLSDLQKSIRKDTILVSIMYVNNEIGTIQPIKEIGNIIKQQNSQTIFHVDAIQAYGKIPIYPEKFNIDVMSVSGHKFYGPKGTGFLYLKRGTRIKPLIYGGGQQRGLRSGTENVPGIAGMGIACKEVSENMEKYKSIMKEVKQVLSEGLLALGDVCINGPELDKSAPHILSVTFKNVRGEVLLHSLEDEGIYISTGSACSSNKPEEKSPSLSAIGLNAQQIDSSVRFSFSKYNTIQQAKDCLSVLNDLIPKLRMFTLGGRRR